MILGRFFGVFLAVVFADIFTDDIPNFYLRLIIWFIIAILGTVLSLIFSGLIGIQGLNDRPLPQDSLDYWLTIFDGDKELAERALKYWYEER